MIESGYKNIVQKVREQGRIGADQASDHLYDVIVIMAAGRLQDRHNLIEEKLDTVFAFKFRTVQHSCGLPTCHPVLSETVGGLKLHDGVPRTSTIIPVWDNISPEALQKDLDGANAVGVEIFHRIYYGYR